MKCICLPRSQTSIYGKQPRMNPSFSRPMPRPMKLRKRRSNENGLKKPQRNKKSELIGSVGYKKDPPPPVNKIPRLLAKVQAACLRLSSTSKMKSSLSNGDSRKDRQARGSNKAWMTSSASNLCSHRIRRLQTFSCRDVALVRR